MCTWVSPGRMFLTRHCWDHIRPSSHGSTRCLVWPASSPGPGDHLWQRQVSLAVQLHSVILLEERSRHPGSACVAKVNTGQTLGLLALETAVAITDSYLGFWQKDEMWNIQSLPETASMRIQGWSFQNQFWGTQVQAFRRKACTTEEKVDWGASAATPASWSAQLCKIVSGKLSARHTASQLRTWQAKWQTQATRAGCPFCLSSTVFPYCTLNGQYWMLDFRRPVISTNGECGHLSEFLLAHDTFHCWGDDESVRRMDMSLLCLFITFLHKVIKQSIK